MKRTIEAGEEILYLAFIDPIELFDIIELTKYSISFGRIGRAKKSTL